MRLLFFYIKYIGQATNPIFNRLGVSQFWSNNWHVTPVKRYYSNLIQRDLFLIKFIPLFFLYGLYVSFFNWWSSSYFNKKKPYITNKKLILSIPFFKVRLRRKRYHFKTRSRYALTSDDGQDIMTIPIAGRKQFFKNFYFSKLCIMHVFGWLILKINILIPSIDGKSKKLSFKNKYNYYRKRKGGFSKLRKPRSFFYKNFNSYNNLIYRKQYNFIKNFFFFKYYLNKNNNLLDNYIWF